jgi:superfamily II DNA or RNA helicase
MTIAKLDLRPYQHSAQIDTVREFLRHDGGWRLLGVLPTASGKTVVFSTLSLYQPFKAYLEAFPPDQRKILVIAHREELLKQAKNKYEAYNPGLIVDIEQADQWARPDADVIIASIQTLASRSGKRLGRLNRNQVRLVVIDEAHHATAPSYVSVLQYFGLLPPPEFLPKPDEKMDADTALQWQRDRLKEWDATGKPARLLLGVTATAVRADRVGLEAVFQKIVFEETILDLIRQGYLSRIRALKILSTVDLDPVKTKSGDFDEKELAAAVDNVERNRVIVKAWIEHGVGRKTVGFCVDVQHALDLAEEFNNAGVRAAAIHGNSTDRVELLNRFEHGDLEILTNCQILTEGTDIPNIQCIIHARPTKSAALYTQMTGRGFRLCPEKGKVDCLLLDIVDLTSRHSLMTAPTLVGLPSEYDAQGRDLVGELDAVEKAKAKNPLLDVSKARSLEDLHAMAEEVDLFGVFRQPEITNNARLSWMKAGEQYQISYLGPNRFDETLRLSENNMGGWDIAHQELDRRQTMASVPDLPTAFKAAEAWLEQHRPDAIGNLSRDARWRRKDMSPGQLKYLNSLSAKSDTPSIDTSRLSAGEASDLIEFFKQRFRRNI